MKSLNKLALSMIMLLALLTSACHVTSTGGSYTSVDRVQDFIDLLNSQYSIHNY